MAATAIGSTGARWAAPARWAVTGVATVVSVLTLDIVATATGVLLVASHAFDGLSRGAALAFLVSSYLLWAAALRVNLIANWRLLEETGTSTNLVSKALFEMARVRSGSRRRGRTASAAGYLATEIAKEAPYYLGAFGTALLSDAVGPTDAIIFLGGTNVGAAAYEYGVGRLSHTFLDRRSLRIARHLRPASLEPPPLRDAA